ncbi:MAG: hypothetical protein QOG79_7617, partial [Mycobacterium sp.]|nr:hypothetical protein [Mycobacterium sp.]
DGWFGGLVIEGGGVVCFLQRRSRPKVMDNRDYPRYPPEIVVTGEWLDTLAHTRIQC